MIASEINLWSKYLKYIAKENKKIERRNDKKWAECKAKQELDNKHSIEWEKSYQKARDAREAKVSKLIADYQTLPFYKKAVTDPPNIFLPFPSSYNPFRFSMYWPFTEALLAPSYEHFLTMLSEGKLVIKSKQTLKQKHDNHPRST